jgi:photosystem II stability/assembly factor-like uncharacterized protein
MKKLYFLLNAVLLIIFIFPVNSSVAQQISLWDQVPEEIREKNSFKRFEWFYRQRAFPYDTISIHTYNTELEKEIRKGIEGDQSTLNNLQWTSIGPSGINSGSPSHWGEMSGRIRGLAVHPTDPNTVYVGVAAGSIWKTTNGGTSWTNVGDNLASITYGAIAIDPNNPNNIYAGAGEIMFNFAFNIYDGRGLYKSTDAGVTWTHITAGFGNVTHFGDLVVSPHNSNLVFGALGSGYSYIINIGNEGIWRSTDAGISWARTLNVADAFDIIVHPTNSNTIYAAAGGALTTSGFYISTDAGFTWIQSNTGLPAATTIRRIQITLANSAPATIYALIYNSSNTTVAYKTTNGGTTWSQISAGTPLGGNYGSGWIDQGWYDLCISADPTNANFVLAGNVELHQTTNGSNFLVNRVAPGLNAWSCPTHVDLHRIVFAPSNHNVIYIACDGGIYKSTNNGTSWASANNGITTIQFYRMASHPSKHDTLIGGAQDNGNFRTFNAGATAWNYTTTGDGMECFFDHTNPNTIYLSTQNGFLGKSTNLGTTVTWFGSIGGSWITPYFMHPTNNQWIYAANNSILRSTNGGTTYTTIASNVSTSDLINTMDQSSVTPNNMIFAGSGSYTSTPQVKVSTDGGFNWTDVTSNIPGAQRYISRVVCHPTNASTMYIVRSGYSSGNKIYMTTNLGSSWSNVTGDLPNIPHNDFFVDPANTTHYYTANDFGVYRSTNSGTNWLREGVGMPFVPAIDFDYVFANGIRYLRVATHGRSAFETDLDFIIPVELTHFTAIAKNSNVELKWITATELNNSGFEIQRSINEEPFGKIAFVPGHGTTTEVQSYNYIDEKASGFLRYRLKQIDYDGTFSFSDIVEVQSLFNLSFELSQNYPNPFNPITNISYTLPKGGRVTLTVYNTIGEVIGTLVNEVQAASRYEAVWDASMQTSGVYFYTLEVAPTDGSEVFKKTNKMILLR